MFDLNISSQFSKNKAPAVDHDKVYDVAVIGGGPAGLNAAMYAKRKGLDVAIIADKLGGQVLDTSSVENYLGFSEISGEGLMEKFKAHVQALEVPILKDARIKEVIDGQPKKLILTDGTALLAKTVIIATGSKPRELGVPGENQYRGRGVAYCAICDGPFFTDRKVIVAGGGNSAVEAAIDLSKIASEVILVHRSQFRADKILLDRIQDIENIKVHLNTQIIEVEGEALMTGVRVLHKENGIEGRIEADGLFVEIGYLPNSEPFQSLVEMTKGGEIIVDDKAQTSVSGIYAAGDVATVPFKQIIIAASEGAKAALAANEYINKL